MANDDGDNGGASCRPSLARQAGDRNLEVDYFGPIGIRNKVKYDESVRGMQEIQRRLEEASKHAPSHGVAHRELLEQTREQFQRLSSNLQETNVQNEETIRNLQRKLIEVTRERDAARCDAGRANMIAAERCTEWEDKLHQERRGFAVTMHKRKKEVLALRRRVDKLERRCQRMECELKERRIPNTVVISADKLLNWAEDRSKESGLQRTATTASDNSDGSAHGDFREQAAQFAYSVDVKLKDWQSLRPETDQESVSSGDERKEPSPPLQPDAENHTLRPSTEELAQLASDRSERTKCFAWHHEASVRDLDGLTLEENLARRIRPLKGSFEDGAPDSYRDDLEALALEEARGASLRDLEEERRVRAQRACWDNSYVLDYARRASIEELERSVRSQQMAALNVHRSVCQNCIGPSSRGALDE